VRKVLVLAGLPAFVLVVIAVAAMAGVAEAVVVACCVLGVALVVAGGTAAINGYGRRHADAPPMTAKARFGAVLIGAVVALVGLLQVMTGGANSSLGNALGQWMLILGGLFALANLALAGFALMRDG